MHAAVVLNQCPRSEIDRELRIAHSMTQQELADKIGLTQQTVIVTEQAFQYVAKERPLLPSTEFRPGD